jgi:hypothetical protein
MEHLSLETLARLVDDVPDREEAEHLTRCRRCRDELEALRSQTVSLSHLPDLRPPREGWARLEAHLKDEGLIRAENHHSRSPVPWLQAAAAAVLLLVGTGVGLGIGSLGDPDGWQEGIAAGGTVEGFPLGVLAALDDGASAPDLSLQEAEALVRLTEEWYRTALVRYRETLRSGEGPGHTPDSNPMTRVAALEALLAASRVAVREAPTDPFLNGLLVNMRAERDATLRGIQASAPGENWF